MKSRWLTLTAVVLLVISAGLLAGSVTPGSQGPGSVDSFKAALRQAGFFVPQQDGELSAFSISSMCCASGYPYSCVYNNFNAPYLASTFVPLGPGETSTPLLDNNFRLGQNEAIILVGQTPPAVRYFGYVVYLQTRRTTRFPHSFPGFTILSDYTADSISHLTLHTSGPPNSPYNRQFLVFIVADRQVEARVQQAARRAGYPPSLFNTIVLPPAVLHLGVDDGADTFILVQRTALPRDEGALDEYLARGQTLLRVTLQDPAWQPDPLPVPRVAVRGTGQTELDLVPAVDALGEAIKARYGGYAAAEQRVNWLLWEGFTGLQEEVNGLGPQSDALYLGTMDSFELPRDKDSFAVIFGVNHETTGKATYSSLALYEDSLKLGLGSVFAQEYAGSATDYLPADTPDVDKLYAWKVAWDCGGDEHCLTIKDPGCARLDLTDESPFKVWFRLYVEPATKTAPEVREVLFDRVLVFTQ